MKFERLIVGGAALLVGLLLGWMVRGVSTYNTHAAQVADKDGKKLLGFILPYGVALEAGMGLRIGKDPVKVYQYRTCNTVGCIAQTTFDDSLAKTLKNADDVAVMFAGLDGKPVSYPLSFKGYGTSYSAWKSQESRRHSWFWRLFS
jgi:invasion protein IalB